MVPLAITDAGILNALEDQLLHRHAIALGIRVTLASVQTSPDAVSAVPTRRELDSLQRQLANVTQAIKLGGPLLALVAELPTLERRRAELQVHLDGLQRAQQVTAG